MKKSLLALIAICAVTAMSAGIVACGGATPIQ